MCSENLKLKYCAACGWKPMRELVDLVAIGLWPVNVQCSAYLDFSFMSYISTLQHFSPVLSMGSILQSLQFVATLAGKVCNSTCTIFYGVSYKLC